MPASPPAEPPASPPPPPAPRASPAGPSSPGAGAPRRASSPAAAAPRGRDTDGWVETWVDAASGVEARAPDDADLDAPPAASLDATLDALRDRFGSTAVTRAVLLGRDQGVSVPLLPD